MIKVSLMRACAAAVVALALFASPGPAGADGPAATGWVWDVPGAQRAMSSQASCGNAGVTSVLGRCRDWDCMEGCSELYWFCLELNPPSSCWPLLRECTDTCWVPCPTERPEARRSQES
jgi:hypothetical protein